MFLLHDFFLLYFTLQYCIGLAIHQHESAMGVHVFPILNPLPPASPSHLSGSSQHTSPKHPVSCIELRLVIHFLYDIIHVSMQFSQIIPPSPSPTESKRLLYICVSFAVLYTGLSLPSFKIPYICVCKPLDESERGEWKSWLKAQHWENEDHGIQSHHFMANSWGKKWTE